MDRKLPDDIIEEIALRLPPRAMGRFRCAAKVWRSRLSSSKFARSHFKFHIHTTTSPVRIFFVSHRSAYSDDYPCPGYLLRFPAEGGLAYVVSSPLFEQGRVSASVAFNGLVVVENPYVDKNNMFLFNPVTRDAVMLPDYQSRNPYECCHFLGFAYDSHSDDYKIVRLSYSEHHYGRKYDGTFVDVYSFRTKSWRKLKNSPFTHELNLPDPCPGVLVDGCLHWLANGKKLDACTIAAFNVASEEFKEVPPPIGSDDSWDEVGVFDDSREEEGSDDSQEDEEEGYYDCRNEEGLDDDSMEIESYDGNHEEECCYDSDEEEGCDDSDEEDFDDSCEAFEGFLHSDKLLVLGGCLAVVSTELDDDDCIQLWVMKEYGVRESWHKLVIDTKGRHIGKFVWLSRKGEIIFTQFNHDYDDVSSASTLLFAAYSLSTEVWRNIKVRGTQYEDIDEDDIGIVATTECLLSPNHLFD